MSAVKLLTVVVLVVTMPQQMNSQRGNTLVCITLHASLLSTESHSLTLFLSCENISQLIIIFPAANWIK